ncbi:MAG: rRNA maturation RNase YbeY [Dehalococcoidia bacterium]|nr:rRNA maturation RNase YbeY [Dehalococcoidia bacterium]
MPTRRKRRVDISILEPLKGFTPNGFGGQGGLPPRAWLRKVASRTLEYALPGHDCQLSLVIADDDTLKCLNSEYRGMDEVTDVLSFSPFHRGHWEGEGEPPPSDDDVPFVLPPQEPQPLGEVIISYPQAMRQSGPGPLGPERELALLVVHGVLHLLGFDHAEPSEETAMQAQEREILSTIFSEASEQ